MGLNTLKVGDSFRVQAEPTEKFEILIKSKSTIFARSVEGKVSKIYPETMVRREADLTRNPGGNIESKVAIATFPVGHCVNYRTVNFAPPYWCFQYWGQTSCSTLHAILWLDRDSHKHHAHQQLP